MYQVPDSTQSEHVTTLTMEIMSLINTETRLLQLFPYSCRCRIIE